MKIKHLIAACLLIVSGQAVVAQDPEGELQIRLKSETENQTAEAQQYMTLDYDGFMFRVPTGMKTERGSDLKVLSPDGTFGISMTIDRQPSTKKIAAKLCERLADSMHIPRNSVKKVKFGRVSGATAAGKIEGKNVTIFVLPHDDHQLQIVIMANPEREEWVKQFIDSLSS